MILLFLFNSTGITKIDFPPVWVGKYFFPFAFTYWYAELLNAMVASLAIFDGYFIAGNIYLSCTTGPGEFVRGVNTVFQLSFAVYLTGGSAGIGL